MACFIHDWSDWIRIPGICREERKCSRCLQTKSKYVNHIFEEWTKLPGKCEEQRICSWCGYTETRKIKHTYGEWEYIEESDCTMKKTCIVCGYQDFTISHDFGDRTYVNMQSRQLLLLYFYPLMMRAVCAAGMPTGCVHVKM